MTRPTKMKVCLALAMMPLLALARDTPIYNGKLTSALNANGMAITNAALPVCDGDVATKAYVDAHSGSGITTNDVCAIVTNNVGGVDWVTNITATSGGKEVTLLNVKWGYGDNPDEWMMKLNVPGIGEAWRPCGSPNNTDPNATMLAASEYPELVTTRGIRNALGLAYLREVAPAVSNTVTKAYVEGLGIEAGISAEAVTNIVESAAVTNAGAVAYADGAVTEKRDWTNNVCVATEFTPWVYSGREYDPSEENPAYIKYRYDRWYLFLGGSQVGYTESAGSINDTIVTGPWLDITGYPSGVDLTATRSPVALSNDVFTTYTVMTSAVANVKIDTTSLAQKTEVAAVSNTVSQWENYWHGDRVRLSVTNYYGNTSGEPPRLMIQESQTNVSGVVTNWVNVWDEQTRQTNYQAQIETKVDTISNAVMYAAYRQTYNQLAGKAPRAWQEVTSAGEAAPDNTVWMTAPNTVFAGGTEYAHVAVGEGTIAVLVDKGAQVYTEGEEGQFRFMDESGENYFGFDVRQSYTLGCRTDGISTETVSGDYMVTLTYDLTSSTNPTILHSTNLVDWTTATVTWEQNPPAGTKICEINCGTDPKGFFKAQIEYAGGAKFITNMQADLAGGIAASNEVSNIIQSIYPVITSTGVVWKVMQ